MKPLHERFSLMKNDSCVFFDEELGCVFGSVCGDNCELPDDGEKSGITNSEYLFVEETNERRN